MTLTSLLFRMARFSNLLRHLRRGTLIPHLLRKWVIKAFTRRLP